MQELTGTIRGIQADYYTHKTLITLEIDQAPDTWIDELRDKLLSITLKVFRKKRSLDSNAYFHVLCGKLKDVLGISMNECKNHLITSYGQIDTWDGDPIVYKTNAPPEYMRQQEAVHTCYFKQGDDGAYWYWMYRGSHTYNTDEMKKLIDGTIAECKEQGIETATPDEIARMQALWSERNKDGKNINAEYQSA